ncbi:hypothetical protein [Pedobacter sp. SYP-B3415]|uniref:hypothetical protein n=1 Tax=Pedobacter sp. SYP-B3415 TaxID=2496641 RepID=UPI00101BA0CB|nr:hypothetical protein [Pedobacter sp. SYP-B3415]
MTPKSIAEIIGSARGKVVFDDLSALDNSADPLDNTSFLKEDLLQIEYRYHILVDAGWYSRTATPGQFIVYVIKNTDWMRPLLRLTANTWAELLNALEEAISLANSRSAK